MYKISLLSSVNGNWFAGDVILLFLTHFFRTNVPTVVCNSLSLCFNRRRVMIVEIGDFLTLFQCSVPILCLTPAKFPTVGFYRHRR